MTVTGHDILLASISAVMGYLLPYLFVGLKYTLDRSKISHIEGVWYGHHYSVENSNIVFRITKWIITKGFKVPYSGKMELHPDAQLSYKGNLFIEGNQIICYLKSVIRGHDEDVSFRSLLPVPPNNEISPGMFLSYDYNKVPMATPMLWSRSELNEDDYNKYLQSHYRVNSKQKLVRITGP